MSNSSTSIIINTGKVITFPPYLAPTDPIFKNVDIIPLNKSIFSRISIMMYKYSKGVFGEMY